MIEPIKIGARGPAVEDVQRRLRQLGYDLGPTGVDGVFAGETLSAIVSFQRGLALDEDGEVGPATWSALVDATFRLGDRLLYLRFPHFHGADVRTLQGALNVLGFSCGDPDGIFGAYTERAVREFQANVGQDSDGIVGSETVRSIVRLRHVWHDKDPSAPASLAVAPARAAEALQRVPLLIICEDESGRAVGERIGNLALAAEPRSAVRVCDGSVDAGGMRLRITAHAPADTGGVPLVALVDEGVPADARFVAASEGTEGVREFVVVVGEVAASDEHLAQQLAVRILDAVCAVLSRESLSVVP